VRIRVIEDNKPFLRPAGMLPLRIVEAARVTMTENGQRRKLRDRLAGAECGKNVTGFWAIERP
jgi:hypothetical protein